MRDYFEIRTEDSFKKLALGVAETVRDIKEIPSGHLYSLLISMSDIDFELYNALLEVLLDAGLIEVKNHLIIWKGGKR